jgi:hypothetical protein
MGDRGFVDSRDLSTQPSRLLVRLVLGKLSAYLPGCPQKGERGKELLLGRVDEELRMTTLGVNRDNRAVRGQHKKPPAVVAEYLDARRGLPRRRLVAVA